MTSIVRLEALSGVRGDGPLCYLLQVDETYLLLDCGWDETFDMAYIEAVKARVPQISAVLISYADQPHLGALPYLVSKCGLTAPVYATVPVYKMGQMFMYDWVNGHMNVEDFELFTLDDVDTAFERVQQVKYNQTVLLKGDSGIQITPMAAGHMIGGAIWRISKAGDEDIVYAVDFNHKKERHLNGCVFDSISRPHLLITDAYNALYNQSRRKDRDEQLVTKMLKTVRDNGDCLVVIDTAGRVLEIAHLLDQLWSNADAGLMTYNLVMLSHVASSVVEFAKSQVEWMSDKILKSVDGGRYNPFAFRHLKLCHSQAELNRVRSPKVVLCSGIDMESGFSRELFLEWNSDSRNSVIVTGRSGDRTLGTKLIRIAEATNVGKTANRQLTLQVKRRIRLEAAELEAYRKKKLEQQQETARQRLEANRRNARLVESSDEDSDDEEALAETVAAVTRLTHNNTPAKVEQTGLSQSGKTNGANLPVAINNHDLFAKWEQQQKSSFFKQNRKTFPMFPFFEEKAKWDDYGELIRPEEYTTVESVVAQIEAQHKEETTTKTEESASNVSSERPQPPVEEAWPTKCVSYVQKMEVLCHVEFIDFEGRVDGESLKRIVAQIKPKQLIIVHASTAATRHLATFARENDIVQGKIFTPQLGEIVDATVESHIFQVSMSDALMNTLYFQTVRDAELSWIDARVIKRKALVDSGGDEEVVAVEEEQPMETDEVVDENADDTKRLTQRRRQDALFLDVLSSGIPSHQAVFVNDPKLSDMKQLLVSEGYQAEFSSGVLFINGIASIRRNEAGRFHVEGCANAQYYKIRDLIYNQFAIV